MSQHLDGRADRQHRRAALGGTLQPRVRDEVAGGQTLGIVFCTAQRVDVEGIGHRVGQGGFHDLGVDTPHSQPLPQYDGVARVAIGAHDVGEDQAYADSGFTHTAPPLASARFRFRKAV
ncbi:Uncharacterised protein [Mycobacteroides abscessus subsp. abscessus]|nr:Uncharacterised protein [Mycobacteroides abscessus subsp. abscessus]